MAMKISALVLYYSQLEFINDALKSINNQTRKKISVAMKKRIHNWGSKISNSTKGKIVSKETCIKLSKSMKKAYKKGKLKHLVPFKKGNVPWNVGFGDYIKGEKNPNWRGGKIKRNELWTNSYKRWKASIVLKFNGKCNHCHKKGDTIDHIIPYRISKDSSLSNIQLLCKSCHSKKTVQERKLYE